jgi:hypothetical protein
MHSPLGIGIGTVISIGIGGEGWWVSWLGSRLRFERQGAVIQETTT